MSTVEKLLSAVEQLTSRQREQFIKKLAELEEMNWQAERRRVGRQMEARGVTDAQIDQFIERRRREKRV